MKQSLAFNIRPFILSLLLVISVLSVSGLAMADPTNSCGPKADLDDLLWTKAQYAISGDTLSVNDKRVRLIGVHAPQREKKQKFHTPGEPLAQAAQDFLNTQLANNDLEIGLQFDTTEKDNRYRFLAHIFFRDGTNLNQKMLQSGYALNRTTYNNTAYASCYYQAEQTARNQNYQLWDLLAQYPEKHFPLVNSSDLTSEDEGFRIIRGEIVKVDKSSSNYILNMDTTGIRVPKKHWQNFDYKQLKALQGQTIEVRGYAYLYKGAMYIVIKHPFAIDQLNPINNQ